MGFLRKTVIILMPAVLLGCELLFPTGTLQVQIYPQFYADNPSLLEAPSFPLYSLIQIDPIDRVLVGDEKGIASVELRPGVYVVSPALMGGAHATEVEVRANEVSEAVIVIEDILVYLLLINTQSSTVPALQDPDFRNGLAIGLDRSQLLFDMGLSMEPLLSFVPQELTSGSVAFGELNESATESSALLSGFTPGPLSLLYGQHTALFDNLEPQFESLSAISDLVGVGTTYGELGDLVDAGDFELARTLWLMDSNNPVGLITNSAERSQYSSPEMDSILETMDAARQAQDGEAYLGALRMLHERALAAMFTIPLYQ